MNTSPNYITDETLPTPIENEDLNAFAPLKEEKHYQFRATMKAWRSKYRRHIGLKQITKQLRAEFFLMPSEVLTHAITKMNAGEFPPNFPEDFKELYQTLANNELASRKLPTFPNLIALPNENLP